MAFQNDIVAYDASGQLVLVVEVKNKTQHDKRMGDTNASQLLVHGLVANARYFLLAMPDRFYLWVDKQQPELVNPDYIIDPLPFLNPYFGMEGVPEFLTEIGFEMVVEAWLSTLTWANDLLRGRIGKRQLADRIRVI